jgi:hypothetical protein
VAADVTAASTALEAALLPPTRTTPAP